MAKHDQIHEFKILIDSWEHAWPVWKNERPSNTLNWKYILENALKKLFWIMRLIELWLASKPRDTRLDGHQKTTESVFVASDGQHAGLTLRFKTNTRIFSLHALTWQFLEAEQKKTILCCTIICTFRSLPLPFPTPEGNKVRLVRAKSKMSHRLTLWIKQKIIPANSVSILNHVGLAWIPSPEDKALSPALSPKAQFIKLEGEKRHIVHLLKLWISSLPLSRKKKSGWWVATFSANVLLASFRHPIMFLNKQSNSSCPRLTPVPRAVSKKILDSCNQTFLWHSGYIYRQMVSPSLFNSNDPLLVVLKGLVSQAFN